MNKMLVLVLTIMLVATIFAAATFSLNAPETRTNGSSGLVSYWAFDEGNGTDANDSIGDNDGILTDGATWDLGLSNNSLSLDGDDDYVLVPHDDSLNMTSNFTIEAWVYIKGNLSTSASPVVAKNNNYWLFIFSDRVRFGTTQGRIDFMTTPELNNWTFFAAMCNGSAMLLYINGELKQTLNISGPILTNTAALTIGGYSTYNLLGLIDEVKLYNTALADSEVKEHYDELNPYGEDAGDGNHTCQEAIDAIDALIEKVKSYDLKKGTENSFVKKLENAKKSLGKENHNAALGQLGAFINHAEAQSGKKLTEEQADEMITDAEAIIEMINACSA